VLSLALGANYGSLNLTFSASSAGMQWRKILLTMSINFGSLEFARYNQPIITAAMMIGCSVLVGQVYIFRGVDQYVRT
jgi:hypothetical protein